jgi:hypothetical protein
MRCDQLDHPEQQGQVAVWSLQLQRKCVDRLVLVGADYLLNCKGIPRVGVERI